MNRRSFLRHSAVGAAGVTIGAAVPRAARAANDRLRIGVIGCGGRGNFLLDQVLRNAPAQNLEVAALCDVWRLNLERTAAMVATRQTTRPRTYRRYSELLNSRDIDAVIVATPDFAHTQILIEAARRKKDVYVEKPMSTVLDQANEALRAVRENNVIVQVGVQRRSDERHRRGAALLKTGLLGKISQVDAAWHDAAPRWARDFSDVRAEDVDWEQYLMFLPREPFRAERFRRWHFYKDFTQGTPALLGAHLIDVGVWFMDDPVPLSATANGGVYVWKDGREHADTIDCVLTYPKEFILQYSTRLGNNHAIPEVIFYGTKGTFDTMSWTASGEGGGEGKITTPVNVPAPAAAAVANASSSTMGVTTATQNDPRIAGDEHMINWLECVRSRQDPNAPVEVGYSHTVASILCFEAWNSGRRQVFDASNRSIRAE